MLGWLIGIYTVYILIKIYLSFMQAGYVNREKKGDPVLMPAGRYLVAGNYAVAKERLAIAETFAEYLIFLWWMLGGMELLQSITGSGDDMSSSLLFLFGFFAFNYIVTLPFGIYSRFVIDQSFGFNRMTPKMYLIDTLKSTALSLLFGGVVFAIMIYIVSRYESWWLWGFLLLFGVALLLNLIYPTVIAPIFNKFTPLEDGRLKESIEGLMRDAGLRSDGIFVMDAGKRDTRLNAYFGGLGKSKRVVLFDTLKEKLRDDELLAVLGHELGHYSHGDIWKNIGMMGVFLFVSFYLLGHIPQSVFTEMGLTPAPGAVIAIIILMLPVLGFIYTPLMSIVSRRNEYEADRYGSEVAGREHLISALLKMVNENRSFPKSDPIYSFFYYSHPPILERLQELGWDPEADPKSH